MSQTAKGEERGGAAAVDCRRRHPRQQTRVPTVVKSASGERAGIAENLSYAGILIHTDERLPSAGEECVITLRFPEGVVAARGHVARVDAERQRFAVEIEHLDQNAQLMLLALLRFGAPARAIR